MSSSENSRIWHLHHGQETQKAYIHIHLGRGRGLDLVNYNFMSYTIFRFATCNPRSHKCAWMMTSAYSYPKIFCCKSSPATTRPNIMRNIFHNRVVDNAFVVFVAKVGNFDVPRRKQPKHKEVCVLALRMSMSFSVTSRRS